MQITPLPFLSYKKNVVPNVLMPQYGISLNSKGGDQDQLCFGTQAHAAKSVQIDVPELTQLASPEHEANKMLQDILSETPLTARDQIADQVILKAKSRLNIGEEANCTQLTALSKVWVALLNRINPYPSQQIPHSNRLCVRAKFTNSTLWGQTMSIASALCLQKLQAGELKTIEDISDYMGRFHKGAMACHCHYQVDVEGFAKRDSSARTFWIDTDRDPDAARRACILLGYLTQKTTDGREIFICPPDKMHDCFTMWAKLPEEAQPLELGHLRQGNYSSRSHLGEKVNRYINTHLLPDILAHPGQGDRKTLEQIALIQGLRAFASEYQRGSSGIDNAVSYVLADYAGIILSRKYPEVYPDLQAITRPINAESAVLSGFPEDIMPFVPYYTSMFIDPPQFPQKKAIG